ncbi:hypothetical protein OG802_24195 [Streptomyces sp. NBC_00704]|uniref:hypothetical protein n=1 Tax=Streptomyces sp. NBC_00704 TaxID=2975809 RepID=UPI002E31BDC1|nr:hypothetical protein [Streptomyces sp. NBC_00704]
MGWLIATGREMTQPLSQSNGATTTDVLIEHRRKIADLEERIKNRRLQAIGLHGTPIVVIAALLLWEF